MEESPNLQDCLDTYRFLGFSHRIKATADCWDVDQAPLSWIYRMAEMPARGRHAQVVFEVDWPVRIPPAEYDVEDGVPLNVWRSQTPPSEFPVQCPHCHHGDPLFDSSVRTIDKVVSSGVLEAVHDKVWFLQEVRRVLQYAGEFVLLYTFPRHAEISAFSNLLTLVQHCGFLPIWWAADTPLGRVRDAIRPGTSLLEGRLVKGVQPGVGGGDLDLSVFEPDPWPRLPAYPSQVLVAMTGVGRCLPAPNLSLPAPWLMWSACPTTGEAPDDYAWWRPRGASGSDWVPEGWCPI